MQFETLFSSQGISSLLFEFQQQNIADTRYINIADGSLWSSWVRIVVVVWALMLQQWIHVVMQNTRLTCYTHAESVLHLTWYRHSVCWHAPVAHWCPWITRVESKAGMILGGGLLFATRHCARDVSANSFGHGEQDTGADRIRKNIRNRLLEILVLCFFDWSGACLDVGD